MISNSYSKDRIVDQIINLLVDFYSYGFSEPIVHYDDWYTSIVYMHQKIALEIEVDWRDFDVFVLVVRLENGDLPNGYYMNQGKPCRYHLQKIIHDRGWCVDQVAFTKISPKKGSQRKYDKQPEERIVNQFYAYKKVLDGCINKLIEEENMIFDK